MKAGLEVAERASVVAAAEEEATAVAGPVTPAVEAKALVGLVTAEGEVAAVETVEAAVATVAVAVEDATAAKWAECIRRTPRTEAGHNVAPSSHDRNAQYLGTPHRINMRRTAIVRNGDESSLCRMRCSGGKQVERMVAHEVPAASECRRRRSHSSAAFRSAAPATKKRVDVLGGVAGCFCGWQYPLDEQHALLTLCQRGEVEVGQLMRVESKVVQQRVVRLLRETNESVEGDAIEGDDDFSVRARTDCILARLKEL